MLHETDSYALVIEMEYGEVTDMSSINASDLDQPPCKEMKTISFCVKSLWFEYIVWVKRNFIQYLKLQK